MKINTSREVHTVIGCFAACADVDSRKSNLHSVDVRNISITFCQYVRRSIGFGRVTLNIIHNTDITALANDHLTEFCERLSIL